MKKGIGSKPLQIATETVRQLSDVQLEGVHGGADRSQYCSSYLSCYLTRCGYCQTSGCATEGCYTK
jgi:hypothetical protein